MRYWVVRHWVMRQKQSPSLVNFCYSLARMENQPTYLVFVYFVYGLAFFSMGLAVWLEAGRTSGFQNIRVLRFLAGFGFLRGLHEWVEMGTILHNTGVV